MEMFNCKFKFAIDICKKWMTEKLMRKNSRLDMRSKQQYKKKCVDFQHKVCDMQFQYCSCHDQWTVSSEHNLL